MTDKNVIGRNTTIDLIDLGINNVPAKVDTGADISSIWASSVKKTTDGLECIFFAPGSPYYSGKVVKFNSDYKKSSITNSFGKKELRFKVKMSIRVKGKRIAATFTLSDRSKTTYPILLGSSLLKGKFLVDVSHAEVSLEQDEPKQAKEKP